MIKIRIGNKLIPNMSNYYAEVWSDGVAVNMLDIYTKILLDLSEDISEFDEFVNAFVKRYENIVNRNKRINEITSKFGDLQDVVFVISRMRRGRH